MTVNPKIVIRLKKRKLISKVCIVIASHYHYCIATCACGQLVKEIGVYVASCGLINSLNISLILLFKIASVKFAVKIDVYTIKYSKEGFVGYPHRRQPNSQLSSLTVLYDKHPILCSSSFYYMD